MKNGFFRLMSCGVLAFALTACLETRESQKEQEEKVVLKKTLTNLQSSTADINARFQDIEDENRRLNGRVEALEARLQQLTSKNEKSGSSFEAKLKENNEIYKEEFGKLGAELTQLKEQLAQIRDESRKAAEAKAAAEAARAAEKAKDPWGAAEEKFDKKEWKEAILDYEKYRSANPNGKHIATATYKIGVCFQELGMAEEARAFYQEVVDKYPKSKDAPRAAQRLKAAPTKKKK